MMDEQLDRIIAAIESIRTAIVSKEGSSDISPSEYIAGALGTEEDQDPIAWSLRRIADLLERLVTIKEEESEQ